MKIENITNKLSILQSFHTKKFCIAKSDSDVTCGSSLPKIKPYIPKLQKLRFDETLQRFTKSGDVSTAYP